MTDAGWNPDPSGRHELRYWDGAAWTDHVSDGGVAGTDPLAPAAPEPVQAALTAAPPPTPVPQATAAPQPQPVAPQPAMAPIEPASDSGPSSKTPLIIGGVVAAVVIAAAAFFVLSGGDDGRDLETARAGLENLLDDNDAPSDPSSDSVDIGDCPFDFAAKVSGPVEDADSEVSDVDADTNLTSIALFLPLDQQALSCGVFADDADDGFFVDIYAISAGDGATAQDVVDEYLELSDDTDVDIDLTDLGKAEGGEMFRACADIFLLEGESRDDFVAEPYCDTVWVSDGLVIGLEQFNAQSIGDDEAKAMLLLMLDEVITVLEGQA